MSKLLLRRGLSTQIPALDIGELGYDIDHYTMRVGNGTSNPARVLLEGATASYDFTTIPHINFGYIDGTVKVPGTTSIRPLTEFFDDIVSCHTFGVFGDGITDDNQAML